MLLQLYRCFAQASASLETLEKVRQPLNVRFFAAAILSSATAASLRNTHTDSVDKLSGKRVYLVRLQFHCVLAVLLSLMVRLIRLLSLCAKVFHTRAYAHNGEYNPIFAWRMRF